MIFVNDLLERAEETYVERTVALDHEEHVSEAVH